MSVELEPDQQLAFKSKLYAMSSGELVPGCWSNVAFNRTIHVGGQGGAPRPTQ